MEFLKSQWEIILGAVLVLIGILSSKKTKNKISEKEMEIKRKKEEELRKKQEALASQHVSNVKKIHKENQEKKELAEKEVKDLKKKLENDPEALKEYLKSKGLKG